MQTAIKDKLYTISKYLELEERAKNKHEYFNEIIRKITGSYLPSQQNCNQCFG